MVAEGILPQQLKVLLSHPQILKVGRLVDADLAIILVISKARVRVPLNLLEDWTLQSMPRIDG